MIAALSWLDARFPPKVTVTKESFDDLIAREHRRSKDATMLRMEIDTIKERLKKEEEATAAIKKVLMEATVAGASQEKRRAAFVESGRMSAD